MVVGSVWAQSANTSVSGTVPVQGGQMKVDEADATDLLITSDEDWQTFTANANQYASSNVKLDADIQVTTMFAATFTGTFDAQ